MQTVILEGTLGKTFGERHQFEVSTAREAWQAMCQFPGFFHQFGMSMHVVRYGSGENNILIDEFTIDMKNPKSSITFTPVVEGSSDVVKIVLGIAIFIAAPYIGAALGATGAFGVGVAGFAANVGVALVLGGVAGLLISDPAVPSGAGDSSTTNPDYLIAGPANAAQGDSVPIVYGRARAGSVVISSGISSELLNLGALPTRAPAPSPSPKPQQPLSMDRSNGGGRGGHNNGRSGGNQGGDQGGSDRGGGDATGGTRV